MPNRTKAPLNNLRQSLPKIEIQGPTADELPATWLTGETIPFTATGGDGQYYHWATTDPKNVAIKNQQDDRCEVAIAGTGSATILAFSAGKVATYKELKGNQPLLKAVDHNAPRNYLEAEQYCQQAGGSLPTRKTIEDILKARKTEVIAWAKKSFPVTLGTSLRIWLKDEKDEAHSGSPSINLETAAYSDHTKAIETKNNEIEAQQNSFQELKNKEQELLGKGAKLPEDEIIKNAENTATNIAIENGDFVHGFGQKGEICNIEPDSNGRRFIRGYIDEAIAAHREKQMALSDNREKLHTAQGDIQRQWKELVDLKIQQAKESVTTYTLCQLNPSTFDQAVASWVPLEGEATPGDRFTTGPFSSQQSGDSPQLPHCQLNP